MTLSSPIPFMIEIIYFEKLKSYYLNLRLVY